MSLKAFGQMRGTTSFSFKPGEHKRIAVKVIDFRGNEVVGNLPVECCCPKMSDEQLGWPGLRPRLHDFRPVWLVYCQAESTNGHH